MTAEPMAEVAATAEELSAAAHRPQSLLLSFFGALVVDFGLPPLPSMTLLDLLGDLGVTEAAARATLKRMTQRGLLVRGQVGRTAEYTLTPLAEDVIREARERVVSPTPFDHPADEWTLLSYSVPESRRDLRHRVRARLSWAGFGGVRDGLWIAPGTVDVAAVLGRSDLADVADLADAFAARPLARDRPRPAGAPRLGRAGRPAGPHLVHRDVELTAPRRRLPGPAHPAGRRLAVRCCAPTRACPPHTWARTGPRRSAAPPTGACSTASSPPPGRHSNAASGPPAAS